MQPGGRSSTPLVWMGLALLCVVVSLGAPRQPGCGGETRAPVVTVSPAAVVPLPIPKAPVLPAGIATCPTLGETSAGGRTCRFYDLAAQRFAEPDDPLLKRVYLYDRRLDLWHSPEGQVVERTLNQKMAPGDPEARFADEQYLYALDDYGDSALWT